MKIYFNGHKFTKSGNYFLSSTEINGARRWLHVYTWELHNNKSVTSGYEIHHIDFNKENNDIGNLEMLSNKEHNVIHANRNKHLFKSDKQLQLLEDIRPLALLAKQGKYLGLMGLRKIRVQKGVFKICKYCDTEFKLNVKSRLDAKFCSDNCREEFHKKARRKTKSVIDCRFCGTEFKRYRNEACCSDYCKNEDTKKRDRERYRIKIMI